jgi:predicted anti-sigma-YlaC factor YlaD
VTVNTLSCRELVELVTDYLEGRLSWADRNRVEAHLGVCEPCRTYLDQMRSTIAATGRVREEDLSEDAKTALLDAFRSWRGP